MLMKRQKIKLKKETVDLQVNKANKKINKMNIHFLYLHGMINGNLTC